MIILTTILFIVMIISSLFLLINFTLMKVMKKMREKNSSFECGFSPMSIHRLPFSIQFFFIAIIFLIFDVEMTLLFPFIKSINLYNINYWLITSITIFIILMLGLFIEWINNLIKWFD